MCRYWKEGTRWNGRAEKGCDLSGSTRAGTSKFCGIEDETKPFGKAEREECGGGESK